MASNPVSPRSNTSADAGDVPNIKSLLRLKKKYDAPEASSLPESYKKNSEKELLWLWCAHNLVRQLKFEYPHLQALCLTPANECGVEKLICTFVKVCNTAISPQFSIIINLSRQFCRTLTSMMLMLVLSLLGTSSTTVQTGQ